jgi:hypothetical protein
MSAIVISSAAAALTTAATVVIATLPEAQSLLAPITEGGSEYALTAAGLLIAFPILALMAIVAGSAQD